AFIIDQSAMGGGATSGVVGVRARVEVASLLFPQADPRFGAFFETGFMFGIGNSFSGSFSGVDRVAAQGPGQLTVPAHVQIPFLAGASVRAGEIVPGAPVFVDFFAGISIVSATQTMQGSEVGAPGGSGFFAQQNISEVDPTFGVGVRSRIAGTPFTLGA